ncbi:MAG TPA: hypothetical protein VEC99_15135, partial [Clostridia bacterium]|nr:hypothetical protein [Clostridia bacterium]
RSTCRRCGCNPRADDLLLARSILMSTEQYYLLSKAARGKSPAENAARIETEIIPQLLAKRDDLANGHSVVFGADEEIRCTEMVRHARKLKFPKTLGLFLVLLYGSILILLGFTLRYVLGK